MPAVCTYVAGSVPPVYSFHRHDAFWLALALAAADAVADGLDAVLVGVHTLRWAAIQEVINTAVALGFTVPRPGSSELAVLAALAWSPLRRDSLR